MTLRGAAALAVAVLFAACANVPAPTQAPSSIPSSQPSPSTSWPEFQPLAVHEGLARALEMACATIEQRVHCQVTRASGARFEAVAPDGTNAADRELTFSASGPIELESEARRLFSGVADAISGDPTLSREWQDEIWAAFADPSADAATLPNGVTWSASRQAVGDVLVWSLSLSW